MKHIMWCSLLLASVPTSQAGIISLSSLNNGVTVNVTSLSGLVTTADLMAGMTVSATFSNGQTQTCTWGATGAGSGGCTGGAAADGSFSLAASADTYTNPFLLTNLSTQALLLSLTLNALPGNAVFDVVATPGLTPGSDLGQAVSGFTTPTTAPDGLGSYLNIVTVGGNPAQGDLYTQLVIDFGITGLATGQTGTFVADTDSIGFTPAGVPEPVTCALCGVTLVAMGLMRRWGAGNDEAGGNA